jgi:hypothetical protein
LQVLVSFCVVSGATTLLYESILAFYDVFCNHVDEFKALPFANCMVRRNSQYFAMEEQPPEFDIDILIETYKQAAEHTLKAAKFTCKHWQLK